jgi:hypothetical protein
MKYRYDQITSDFQCKHCRQFITTDPSISGVNNRNHCPYCLWSRHMDLETAGDRLSACKGLMQPVGLTLKESHKKYNRQHGELMIIHHCTECGKLSINRIAADDLNETLLQVFEASIHLNLGLRQQIQQSGIHLLNAADESVVHARLYGWDHPAPVLQRSFA